MMDVITGAMGAFLIVMVVLARYYESDPENRENVDALKAELSAARDRLRDIDLAVRQTGENTQNIVDALNRANKNLRDAELSADRLREQLDQAKQEIRRQEEALKGMSKKRGFSVASFWTCEDTDVDIYVWDTQHAASDQSPAPDFDPAKEQNSNWNTDFRADWETNGAETWYVGSSVNGTTHKVYIKLVDPDAVTEPCTVQTTITHGAEARKYERTLSSSEPWTYLARVEQKDDLEFGDFEIITSSEEEKEAERKAVLKNGPSG